jgi:enoyl-[acyl-carrier-protein] reductase (NADH)
MRGIRYNGFSFRPQVSACADESKRTKRKPFKHIDMDTIERRELRNLIASTEQYIADLDKVNHSIHFYQFRLADCNNSVCNDTRETIKILQAKLSNYTRTLEAFKQNDK